jgi:glyoxylase-like metal-dependent hydrolase (beta-lactamase superfamily II)
MHEFRKLTDGVYAFLQPPLVWYSSVGVIVGDRDVIMVDSLTNAAMTEELQSEIRRVTDKPVRFLVNTHSHADHVYTNHLFLEAMTIASSAGRERTVANQKAQSRHDALFAEHFPDVDFRGSRYTPQDLAFRGSLTLHQGAREVRVLELGAGHSESDVIVHLPAERIVFCGDLLMNGMLPLPGEGQVTGTIANYKAIEALGAEIYVAGHGAPGTLADVRAQRSELERIFSRARECFERGLVYDEALQAVADDPMPADFRRMILLAGYCEFAGKRPESADPASRDHFSLLKGIAAEARRQLGLEG